MLTDPEQCAIGGGWARDKANVIVAEAGEKPSSRLKLILAFFDETVNPLEPRRKRFDVLSGYDILVLQFRTIGRGQDLRLLALDQAHLIRRCPLPRRAARCREALTALGSKRAQVDPLVSRGIKHPLWKQEHLHD
jgi:hypothetical protein